MTAEIDFYYGRHGEFGKIYSETARILNPFNKVDFGKYLVIPKSKSEDLTKESKKFQSVIDKTNSLLEKKFEVCYFFEGNPDFYGASYSERIKMWEQRIPTLTKKEYKIIFYKKENPFSGIIQKFTLRGNLEPPGKENHTQWPAWDFVPIEVKEHTLASCVLIPRNFRTLLKIIGEYL